MRAECTGYPSGSLVCISPACGGMRPIVRGKAKSKVDRLYRTRENRRFCREYGIRFSGLPLGRPRKDGGEQTPRGAGQDERDRSAIEGKFGQGKRRFGLGGSWRS